MTRTLRRAAFVLGLGLMLGLAMGLFVGWKVWPVRYANVTPADLDSTSKEDYVTMIGVAYARTGDLTMAMSRLNALNYDLTNVERLAKTAIERGLSAHQAEMLEHLAGALYDKQMGERGKSYQEERKSRVAPRSVVSRRDNDRVDGGATHCLAMVTIATHRGHTRRPGYRI